MKIGKFEIVEHDSRLGLGDYYIYIPSGDNRNDKYLHKDGTISTVCGIPGWYNTVEDCLKAIEKHYQNLNNLNNHEILLTFMGFSVHRINDGSRFHNQIYICKRVPGRTLYIHPNGKVHNYNNGFYKNLEEVSEVFSKYLGRL